MIKRYTLYRHGRAPNMFNHGDGDYVRYADIAHLLEEKTLEQHRAEFELWLSNVETRGAADFERYVEDGFYMDWDVQRAWISWKAARGITE